MSAQPRVLIWNEGLHERQNEQVRQVYPEGLHGALAQGLLRFGLHARTATLEEPEHGLTDDALAQTDVLLWWGHQAHHQVQDEIVARLQARVLAGMGLIVLHSAHHSKLFRRLMGTSCDLRWRDIGERERLWVVAPWHPIVAGLGEYIQLEREEMYGEFFDVPAPDELVLVSWFQGGEVFRSGCCFRRGLGKIFYFRPGHETFPTYRHPQVQQLLYNAVRWATPEEVEPVVFGHRPEPLEKWNAVER
ncbi:MAG TPA: ThuA domain-containing protein [Anaerolineales bacterium]|nr:ThuA domain-containing protein [Anaerolineales bacterium]